MGYRINDDKLRRYVYPVENTCPKRNSKDHIVIHCDSGVLMTKGPKSERIPIPTHIEHLQTMWSLAKSCVPIDPACCFCERGSDVAALRTCAVCMQTSHGECEDPSGIDTCFHSFEPELLTDMFDNFNMCHLCLSCFG